MSAARFGLALLTFDTASFDRNKDSQGWIGQCKMTAGRSLKVYSSKAVCQGCGFGEGELQPFTVPMTALVSLQQALQLWDPQLGYSVWWVFGKSVCEVSQQRAARWIDSGPSSCWANNTNFPLWHCTASWQMPAVVACMNAAKTGTHKTDHKLYPLMRALFLTEGGIGVWGFLGCKMCFNSPSQFGQAP